MANWLTTDLARDELVAEVLDKHRGASEGKKPTVANVREAAKRWKDVITHAEAAHASLPAAYQARFVALLAERKARKKADVDAALGVVHKEIAEVREQQRHAARARRGHVLAGVAVLDAGDQTRDSLEPIGLGGGGAFGRRRVVSVLLGRLRSSSRGPPYGMEFQSGRRVTSAKKKVIANDGLDEALALLGVVLKAAFARMSEDSHALIFTGWRHEPAFRAVVAAAGFSIKGSLVWVKNNHGTGDLQGSTILPGLVDCRVLFVDDSGTEHEMPFVSRARIDTGTDPGGVISATLDVCGLELDISTPCGPEAAIAIALVRWGQVLHDRYYGLPDSFSVSMADLATSLGVAR